MARYLPSTRPLSNFPTKQKNGPWCASTVRARTARIGHFPICIAKDGTVIVGLQWDYSAWTAGAARFSAEVQKFAAKPPGNNNVFVAISGQASSRLHQELEMLGDKLKDHLSPGPLK
jgi:hypothetical protein